MPAQCATISAHLAGQSLGGRVAMQVALRHPARVAGLELTTPMDYAPHAGAAGTRLAGYAKPDGSSNLHSSLDVLRAPTFENVRRRMARILADPARLTGEAIGVRQALYAQPALAEVQQRFIADDLAGDAIRRHRVSDALAACIAQPTLVYWRDKNRTSPAPGEHLARIVQNGRFHCAANTGHRAQFESADEHNRVVGNFLASLVHNRR